MKLNRSLLMFLVLSAVFLVAATCKENLPKAETFTGTVKFLPDIEGGCWQFRADDGAEFEPREGPETLYHDGVRAQITGMRLDVATTCMVGTPFQVVEAEILPK